MYIFVLLIYVLILSSIFVNKIDIRIVMSSKQTVVVVVLLGYFLLKQIEIWYTILIQSLCLIIMLYYLNKDYVFLTKEDVERLECKRMLSGTLVDLGLLKLVRSNFSTDVETWLGGQHLSYTTKEYVHVYIY